MENRSTIILYRTVENQRKCRYFSTWNRRKKLRKHKWKAEKLFFCMDRFKIYGCGKQKTIFLFVREKIYGNETMISKQHIANKFISREFFLNGTVKNLRKWEWKAEELLIAWMG